MPSRLDLDYGKQDNPGARAQWLLVAVAAIFAADVTFTYLRLDEELVQLESRLLRSPRPSAGAAALKVGSAPPSEEELIAARDTIRRVAMPWDALFRALESAQTEGASLLSIEPDIEQGSVLLTGEARDYLRLLNYVSALSSVGTLSNVHLVRHEVKSGEPQRPLGFAISAKWEEAR